MEDSSEPRLSGSAGDTEAESGNGPEVGAQTEREMIPDADAPDAADTSEASDVSGVSDASDEEWEGQLTPRQIVAELDQYIVGQDEAKKAVAIALRNRWRRQRVGEELRDEILPNNLILIGPTGVGKTEIARRLARLPGARFVTVEASKYSNRCPITLVKAPPAANLKPLAVSSATDCSTSATT